MGGAALRIAGISGSRLCSNMTTRFEIRIEMISGERREGEREHLNKVLSFRVFKYLLMLQD